MPGEAPREAPPAKGLPLSAVEGPAPRRVPRSPMRSHLSEHWDGAVLLGPALEKRPWAVVPGDELMGCHLPVEPFSVPIQPEVAAGAPVSTPYMGNGLIFELGEGVVGGEDIVPGPARPRRPSWRPRGLPATSATPVARGVGGSGPCTGPGLHRRQAARTAASTPAGVTGDRPRSSRSR